MSNQLLFNITSIILAVIATFATIASVVLSGRKNREEQRKQAEEEKIANEKRTLTIENRLDNVEEKVSNLKGEVSDLRNEVYNIHGGVSMILGSLGMSGISGNKKSPIVLTEEGKKIFDEVVTIELYNELKEQLLEEMSKQAPETALDVERVAMNVLLSWVNRSELNPLKVRLYNYPSQEGMGVVSLPNIFFILSIVMRDDYLERHPEVLR